MAREIPFFIEGKVVDILSSGGIALVKVPNGNIYNLYPTTPGIDFEKLEKGLTVTCEVTTMLTRVLSAKIKEQ